MLSLIVSLISGIALSFAFPRANLHWVAWFALAPLMYHVYQLPWKRALLSGLAFGLGYFGSLLYWIVIFGKLPWVLLAIFQALFMVIFVIAAKALGGRLGLWGRFVVLPATWISVEWLRSLGMFGFTWGDIGYSQYRVASADPDRRRHRGLGRVADPCDVQCRPREPRRRSQIEVGIRRGIRPGVPCPADRPWSHRVRAGSGKAADPGQADQGRRHPGQHQSGCRPGSRLLRERLGRRTSGLTLDASSRGARLIHLARVRHPRLPREESLRIRSGFEPSRG